MEITGEGAEFHKNLRGNGDKQCEKESCLALVYAR